MNQEINDADIVAKECRHAVFCPPPYEGGDDLHYIKEICHVKTPDGIKLIPRLVEAPRVERTFYVSKPAYRDYEEKKEWAPKEHLVEYKCTQSQLTRSIARALGRGFVPDNQRRILLRPALRGEDKRYRLGGQHVYGADIKSTAVIKRRYQDKYPDAQTPASYAAYDIETDVVHGTDEILMATLSFGSKIITAVDKRFFKGWVDVENRLYKLFDELMVEEIKARKIEWEMVLVDGPAAVVTTVFAKAHEWQPDFICIWNINFDLPKTIKALEKAGIDPKDVFSDPSVPKDYRHFYYKVGKAKMTTASGKVKPKKWVEQWHTVFCPASFYFIDAACAYKAIRTGQGDEPSYALEAILTKHKLPGKMWVDTGGAEDGIEWHQTMQEKFPFEYTIYNILDCVRLEQLDEKINDVRLTLPMMAGCSDYEDFSSQPRCSADNFHYFLLSKGYVIGTTADNMEHEFDKLCVSIKGWISTLPAHLVADNGLKLLADYPNMRTNIRVHVGDLDVAASYPNAGSVFNVSKDTTVREIHQIQGIDFETQREQGINLSGGHTNAVEFATQILGLPHMHKLLEEFNKQK